MQASEKKVKLHYTFSERSEEKLVTTFLRTIVSKKVLSRGFFVSEANKKGSIIPTP
jgi:hypothetical protein